MAQGVSFRWMIVWFSPLFFSLIVGHLGVSRKLVGELFSGSQIIPYFAVWKMNT